MLYLHGPAADAHGLRAIAMVGSRNPTPQGLANARQFSRCFAQAGLTVVSGLALGMDGAAHEGALTAPRPASWPPSPWSAPDWTASTRSQHLELAHRIASAA